MAEPRVPDREMATITLPCERTIGVHDLDMGLRDFECSCGDRHAVVMDVHPLSRWVPESIVDILRVTVDTSDEWDEFGTVHLMGMVLEEIPEAVTSADLSEDGSVGYTMIWTTEFESQRLHEIIVELVVELMDHAISHAEDDTVGSQFEDQMHQFDVAEFVAAYRADRDFDDEFDQPT
jgi:hypothetical protein